MKDVGSPGLASAEGALGTACNVTHGWSGYEADAGGSGPDVFPLGTACNVGDGCPTFWAWDVADVVDVMPAMGGTGTVVSCPAPMLALHGEHCK